MPPSASHSAPWRAVRERLTRWGAPARTWWMAHGTLSRAMAAEQWPQCRTFAAADQVLHRVVPASRRAAECDLAAQIPSLTSDVVQAAVRLGPDVVFTILARADCTIEIARTMLTGVEAWSAFHHTTPLSRWHSEAACAVLRAVGGRGWSLAEVRPETLEEIAQVVLGNGTPYTWSDVGHAWAVVLTVPRLSPTLFDHLLQQGSLPRTDRGGAQILKDPRLSADQRRAVWGRLVRADTYDGGSPFFTVGFDWSLPGAIEALVDHYDGVIPSRKTAYQETAVRITRRALREAAPAERARWWQAIARAEPSATARFLGALWRDARADLLAWDDGVSAMLLNAGAADRLEVLTALGECSAALTDSAHAVEAPQASVKPGTPAPNQEGAAAPARRGTGRRV